MDGQPSELELVADQESPDGEGREVGEGGSRPLQRQAILPCRRRRQDADGMDAAREDTRRLPEPTGHPRRRLVAVGGKQE